MENDQIELEQQQNPSNQDPPVTIGDHQIPAWQATLFEANQSRLRAEERARQLEAQLAQNQPKPIETPLEPTDIIQNPENVIQRINRDMAQQVAPLNEYIKNQQRLQKYAQLKALAKQQVPAFAQIEHLVDSQFNNNPLLQPDEPTLVAVIQNVLGALHLQGAFNQPNPLINNQIQNPNQNNQMIPPNLPPSPPARRQINTPVEPTDADLTENERRLAREQGWNPSEFIKMRDASPDQVTAVYRELLKSRKDKKGGK